MSNDLSKALKRKTDAQLRLLETDSAPVVRQTATGDVYAVSPTDYMQALAAGKNITITTAGNVKTISAAMNLLGGAGITISEPDANGQVTVSGTVSDTTILGKTVEVADFAGKDGYVLTYDETAGKFFLSEKSGALPQATDAVLGGVKAKAKTSETGEVAIDGATGKLFAPESSYSLPQADATTLGGVKAKAKTSETIEVAIESATGKLFIPAPDEATNGIPAGGTAGQILSKVDATDYNAQWIDAPSGGGGGIGVVTELPSNPSHGQTVFLYNTNYQYLATYHEPSGLWYRVSMVGSNYPWANVYKPEALYNLLLGDATKSIVEATVSTDFSTALRIKGAANTTKQLTWTFTSGAGKFAIWLGCETENVNYDYGYIYIDDVDVSGRLGGTILLKYIENTLTAGPHTLKITYRKDSSGNGGYDGIQVYAVSIP